MNIFTLTIPAQSTSGNINYTVKIQKYNSTWSKIFDGKVYVASGQTKVNIELGDILWSYKFDGENYMSPVLNSAGDNYVMCSTANTIDNYWYNQVRIEVPTLGVQTTKYVNFFRYNMIGYNTDAVANNTVALSMDYQPVAHLPKTVPTGFEYRQLVWNGTFQRQIDNTTTVTQRSKLGTLVFSGGNESYGINNTRIATIDPCSKPYYLAWMTNTGAMQVQGFMKSSEFSLSYDNNTRIDMSNYEWNYNKSVTAKWSLKSVNLSDKDYKAYGEMFNSPYLILIDTSINKMYYVNVKSTDYTEKKNGQNGNRKIFFEVNVEACEKMVV